MLRITVNKSAAAAKKYYSEMYYSEGQQATLSYYEEKDQAIGTWHGKAAEQLGLKGSIHKDDFGNLCDNINPITGEQLTERNNLERRVGYDFTFNASKSVSLAYTFANDNEKKQILTAFQQSVKEAMLEVENGIQARVRKAGQNENRETSNIIYGEFVHTNSRPVDGIPDPHLHAHCFAFNATYDQKEETWKAAQFGQIKKDAPYYEAVFHSALAEKLSNLGYGIERTKNGFEIKGIERETIDKFSRRTEEIENVAKEKDITDAAKKSGLGAKTRESKRESISPEEQIKNWNERLNQTEVENFKVLKKSGFTDEKKKEDGSLPENAVTYSLNHHLERKSVATDKEILTTALRSSYGETNAIQIKEAFRKNQSVITVKEDSQTFITTKEALEEENKLISKAYASKGAFKPINEAYTPTNPQLTDEQIKAIKHALTTSDGITIIAGKAGTGKTTLMREVQAGIKASGKEMFAFAPSAEASRSVQRKEGFENAETVASLIQNKDLQEKVKGSVIWIDEAGMLSNKDMNRLLDISAHIILTGDIKQHNSVERGDALRTLQVEADITPIQVNKIQRQKNELYKQAVQFLGKSDVEKGFSKLEKIGVIHEIEDGHERISTIANDYYNSCYKNVKKNKAENEVLVVSPTHAEGERVTQEIRETLRRNNIIDITDRKYRTFKNLQLTAAEKEKKENYTADKWLIFHQNCKGYKAGSRYQIIGAGDKNTIEVKDITGTISSVPITSSTNYHLFEPKEVPLAKGDKIRITGNGKAADGKHLFNGTLYKVNGFDKEGNIRLSNGSTLSKDYGHFALGYVVTSHASQGKTVDKVIISQSSMSFRASSQEQFYVSVSRGREAVSIYTDDKGDLLEAVKRSNERRSAIDLTRKNRLMNNAIEISRQSFLKRIKEQAYQAVAKLKGSINKKKSYELQR